MTTDDYKKIAHTIPTDPGVYRFLDEGGTILYVGKAKNLRNRVTSYFGERKDRMYRTRTMVKHAQRIELTVVETETDALLLENALIKQYQPRYNVMLKDGKSYTYLCIKNERFPRVFTTRRVIRDGSVYFGPYTSAWQVRTILELIKQLFPLRTCTLNLAEKYIQEHKYKVCLEYHIKNCMGPCEGLESEADYLIKIEQIKNILKGNFSAVIQHFKQKMEELAADLEFERAQEIKEKLSAFQDYQSKSVVVSSTIRDVDVFSILVDEKEAFVNYLKIVNGAIIHTHTQELITNLDEEEPADLLTFTIDNLRERFNSVAPEIIVPFELIPTDTSLLVTVPKIGDKKKLLNLSEKNLQYFALQKRKEAMNKTQKQTPAERILSTLQADLRMQNLPLHIECFDNSNLQGTNPVSSCVVFKNAKPSNKDYRHFNVKTVEGPNDFASMSEVVYRRYKRLLSEGKSLPQLIVIDGGKGQLSAAMESIQALGIQDQVTVIGIAKRLEEIFFPGDSIPLYISKKSESLKLIQQARNEAHRFAISFHRDQRSRQFLKTALTNVPGVGEKTAEKLISHFGSVKSVLEADPDDLANIAGQAVTNNILRYFFTQEEE